MITFSDPRSQIRPATTQLSSSLCSTYWRKLVPGRCCWTWNALPPSETMKSMTFLKTFNKTNLQKRVPNVTIIKVVIHSLIHSNGWINITSANPKQCRHQAHDTHTRSKNQANATQRESSQQDKHKEPTGVRLIFLKN